MKQSEIKKCNVCGKGVMHDRNLTFFRFRLQYMVADLGAIHRQAGLEMFLGSVEIAAAMGPQEDMAKELQEVVGLICLPCALGTPVAGLVEMANTEEDTAA